jgi:hypothetical protein
MIIIRNQEGFGIEWLVGATQRPRPARRGTGLGEWSFDMVDMMKRGAAKDDTVCAGGLNDDHPVRPEGRPGEGGGTAPNAHRSRRAAGPGLLDLAAGDSLMRPLARYFTLLLGAFVFVVLAVSAPPWSAGRALAAEQVNIYSFRQEVLLRPLLDEFTARTGIEVKLVSAKADRAVAPGQAGGCAAAGRLGRDRTPDPVAIP